VGSSVGVARVGARLRASGRRCLSGSRLLPLLRWARSRGYVCILALSLSIASNLPAVGEVDRERARERGVMSAVLRGLNARAEALDWQLQSLKGLWRRTASQRQAIVPEPVPDNPAHFVQRAETRRMFVLISGEKYRQEIRGEGRSGEGYRDLQVYDGQSAWEWEYLSLRPPKARLLRGDRQPVHTLLHVFPLGLTWFLDGGPEARLAGDLQRWNGRLLREELVAGHRTYVVECRPDVETDPTETYWICPDYGYAVARSLELYQSPRSLSPRYHHRRLREHLAFRQVAPGLWLPWVTRYTTEIKLKDGTWHMTSQFTFEAEYIKTNIPIPEEQFALPEDIAK
jgi:hypothetical protein